jgi:hypothetical protein
VVEHQLPKLRVAGSIPVSRSIENQSVGVNFETDRFFYLHTIFTHLSQVVHHEFLNLMFYRALFILCMTSEIIPLYSPLRVAFF